MECLLEHPQELAWSSETFYYTNCITNPTTGHHHICEFKSPGSRSEITGLGQNQPFCMAGSSCWCLTHVLMELLQVQLHSSFQPNTGVFLWYRQCLYYSGYLTIHLNYKFLFISIACSQTYLAYRTLHNLVRLNGAELWFQNPSLNKI